MFYVKIWLVVQPPPPPPPPPPRAERGGGAHYGIQYERIKEKVHDTRYQYELHFFYNESTKHCWCFFNFYLAAPQPTLSNF